MCQEPKYHIITYGCQMNKSDSERIATVLNKIGYKKSSKQNEADLIILNACSVRQSAIDRVYGKINNLEKLKTTNYKLQTIVTGCVLKKDKEKFKNLADLILDIKDLPKLPKLINRLSPERSRRPACINRRDHTPEPKFTSRLYVGTQGINFGFPFSGYLQIKPRYQNKVSASVPIMTGCNNFCSYCAVPYTRGREISRPAEEIIHEVKNLIKKGYKEIWLLGQNVNSYNSRINTNLSQISQIEINFAKLLKKINAIRGDFLIRFTSPHPKDFSDELIKITAKCEKFAPYLNLPVQSGDNEILKKMNRPYIVEHYKKLVRKIKKEFVSIRQGLEKQITISTDVIVGFPGETKKQFQNTAKLFREIGFDMAYIAQYSPRPGTVAAKLKDNVPREEKKRREKVLTEILKKSALKNNKKYLGKICGVLVEKSRKDYLLGKTRSYKTIKIYFDNSNYQNRVNSFCYSSSDPDVHRGSREVTSRGSRFTPRFARGSLEQYNNSKTMPDKEKFVGQFVKVKITGAMEWGLKGTLL